MAKATSDRTHDERRLCERWFVRRGLPHLIDDYSARTDVLTRMAPFLAVVLFSELFLSFGDRWKGWAQFGAFISGIAAITLAVTALNRLRGRRPLQLPDSVGPFEIGLFLVLPLAPTAIGSQTALAENLAWVMGFNIAVLAVGYGVTSWGLLPMFRWSLGQLRYQIGDVTTLAMKSLPILLVFSAFVFLNAEMWQVANDFTLPFFGVVCLLVGTLTAAFVAVSVGRITVDLARFGSWGEVRSRCAGSPMQDLVPAEDAAAPDSPPLERLARFNVWLLLFVSQIIQIVLVGLVITVFYVVFGIFAVREDTLVLWTSAVELTRSEDWVYYWTLLGGEVVFSRQLLLVSAFIGLVASLQFAVHVVTDEAYRAEFAAEMTDEVRDALAVRAVYLRRLATPDAPDAP